MTSTNTQNATDINKAELIKAKYRDLLKLNKDDLDILKLSTPENGYWDSQSVGG
jgi:hypothetical protein